MKLHVESKHQGVSFVCDQCGYKASRRSNLKRHDESSHEGVCYMCDQCNVNIKQLKKRVNIKQLAIEKFSLKEHAE